VRNLLRLFLHLRHLFIEDCVYSDKLEKIYLSSSLQKSVNQSSFSGPSNKLLPQGPHRATVIYDTIGQGMKVETDAFLVVF